MCECWPIRSQGFRSHICAIYFGKVLRRRIRFPKSVKLYLLWVSRNRYANFKTPKFGQLWNQASMKISGKDGLTEHIELRENEREKMICLVPKVWLEFLTWQHRIFLKHFAFWNIQIQTKIALLLRREKYLEFLWSFYSYFLFSHKQRILRKNGKHWKAGLRSELNFHFYFHFLVSSFIFYSRLSTSYQLIKHMCYSKAWNICGQS